MEILDRPAQFEDRTGPTIWVDEAIWGHRLHDEQSPWLTFLEFLTVLLAEHGAGRALQETSLNSLSYRPQTQLKLRNLVFNNPHIMTVLAEDRADELAWTAWLEKMAQSAGGLESADFAYLRERFETFQDFAAVINFLQGSAIEGDSNKRWSSKFVFPFGPHALYEDVSVSPKGGVSTDRRFFARTGEVLYLMLCRSQRAAELRPLLVSRFLQNPAPYDGMAQALQGEPQFAKAERGGAFLPCSSHPVFDRLADDWLAILSLPIPAYDAIPHLVAITGLNLILYQLDPAPSSARLWRPRSRSFETSRRTPIKPTMPSRSRRSNASSARPVRRRSGLQRWRPTPPPWRRQKSSKRPSIGPTPMIQTKQPDRPKISLTAWSTKQLSATNSTSAKST